LTYLRKSKFIIYRLLEYIHNMELSNYKVEIIGGRHMSQPNTSTSSPFSSVRSPWSPWSPWNTNNSTNSIWSPASIWDNKDNKDKSYVEMRDGDHYVISLYNGHSTRCHAKITIDGKPVGTWILEPWGSARLERPVDVAKKFTFFKVNSRGGAEAGLIKGDSQNGLVTVEFIPEVVSVKTANFFECNLDRCLGSSSRRDEEMDFGDDFDHDQDILSGGILNLPTLGQHSKRSLNGRTAQFRSDTKPRLNYGLESSNSMQAQSFEAGGTGLKGRSDQDFRISHERMQLDPNAKVTINLRLVARKDIDYDRVTPLGARSNGVPPPIF